MTAALSRSQKRQADYFALIPEDERCHAVVHNDAHGRLREPRRCRAKKKYGTFCGPHAKAFSVVPLVTSADGGWCIWCGQPARRYDCSRADVNVTLALCGACGTGLFRALQHHVKKTKRKS